MYRAAARSAGVVSPKTPPKHKYPPKKNIFPKIFYPQKTASQCGKQTFNSNVILPSRKIAY
jgi:hypothetical protein